MASTKANTADSVNNNAKVITYFVKMHEHICDVSEKRQSSTIYFISQNWMISECDQFESDN